MFGKEKSQYIEDSRFRYTMREMKKNGSAYILALPYFLLFLVFTGIPVVISLPVGFTNFNMVQFPQWVGLSNFYTLFLQDDVFLIAIQNTLVFAIITGPVSYIMCFLLAWLINEMPGPLKTVFTYIFYAPTLAGNIYATWQLIFSGDTYGFLNSTHEPRSYQRRSAVADRLKIHSHVRYHRTDVDVPWCRLPFTACRLPGHR